MRTTCRAETVYFDGTCPLCSLEISHYRAQDGADQLCFVDVSKAGAELAEGLSAEAALDRFHVRADDGTLISGAAAFAAVWETLPRWRWLARLSRLPGVLPLLELGYRGFLPLRPVLARIVRRVKST